MSMSELTDDQLDGLFRKSAEEFDPSFDPVAWQDMKTRLDANDRTVTGGLIWQKLLRWGLPVLLLLLIGGSWYAYRGIYSGTSKSVSPISTKARPTANGKVKKERLPDNVAPVSLREAGRTTTAGSKESDVDAGKQSAESVASVATPDRPANRDDEPVTTLSKDKFSASVAATKRSIPTYRNLKAKRSRSSETLAEKSAGTTGRKVAETTTYRSDKLRLKADNVIRRQRKAIVNRHTTSFTSPDQAVTAAMPSTKQRVLNSQKSMTGDAVNVVSNEKLSTVSETGVTLSDLRVRPAKWGKLFFTDRQVTIQPDTTARSIVPKFSSDRGLSLRFVVAPDLSSIGLKNFSRPGTNIGLLLEYRLASRWSVQAGVIQSTKVYRALPDEYTASYGEWNGHVKPESIDGRCNMLDIPINLRYDIVLRPGRDGRSPTRFFVSGGATSYIMNKEHYVYNYPPLGYPQRESRDTTTGGYRFSNLNLSVGYERALSRRLSWQVEPFIKVPIKSVGYFKTNLISTGAFFSIRYKFF